MKAIISLLLCSTLWSLPILTFADVLLLERIESAPPNTASGVLRPVRGQSMGQVREAFGEPVEMLSPVGDPPITRWIYARFTVYFEQQFVIYSALNPSGTSE